MRKIMPHKQHEITDKYQFRYTHTKNLDLNDESSNLVETYIIIYGIPTEYVEPAIEQCSNKFHLL